MKRPSNHKVLICVDRSGKNQFNFHRFFSLKRIKVENFTIWGFSHVSCEFSFMVFLFFSLCVIMIGPIVLADCPKICFSDNPPPIFQELQRYFRRKYCYSSWKYSSESSNVDRSILRRNCISSLV